MATISPAPKLQFFDTNGDPLVAGLLYSYAPGTTTPKATYVDAAQSAANANPIVLDARGECACYLVGPTKIVLKTAGGATIWTQDNVIGSLLAPSDYSLVVSSPSGTSNIDPTYPVENAGTLESIRQNFAHAKAEIEELNTAVQQFYPGGLLDSVNIRFAGDMATSPLIDFDDVTLVSTATGVQSAISIAGGISPQGASLTSLHLIRTDVQLTDSAVPITTVNVLYSRADSDASYTANVGTYNGMLCDPPVWSGTGTIDKFNGVRVGNPGAKVTGEVTAIRGEVNSATDRYNLYMTGTAVNWLRGNLLIGLNNNADNGIPLDVAGDSMRLSTTKTPASAAATGIKGQICWDASYIYVCTATDTWKRAAIATW